MSDSPLTVVLVSSAPMCNKLEQLLEQLLKPEKGPSSLKLEGLFSTWQRGQVTIILCKSVVMLMIILVRNLHWLGQTLGKNH